MFSLLRPHNSIQSQLIIGGKLVTNGSDDTVTYQAVADPDGSFNSTVAVSWPVSVADSMLEASATLGPAAVTIAVTNHVTTGANTLSVILPASTVEFLRGRRPW